MLPPINGISSTSWNQTKTFESSNKGKASQKFESSRILVYKSSAVNNEENDLFLFTVAMHLEILVKATFLLNYGISEAKMDCCITQFMVGPNNTQ